MAVAKELLPRHVVKDEEKSSMCELRNAGACIDRVFVAVFARYRRRNPLNLKGAWHAAEYQVGTYTGIPLVQLVVFGIWLSMPGHYADSEFARRGVAAAGVVSVLIAQLLIARRFKVFLLDPPPLALVEPLEDRKLVSNFRLACVSVTLVTTSMLIAYGTGTIRNWLGG